MSVAALMFEVTAPGPFPSYCGELLRQSRCTWTGIGVLTFEVLHLGLLQNIFASGYVSLAARGLSLA